MISKGSLHGITSQLWFLYAFFWAYPMVLVVLTGSVWKTVDSTFFSGLVTASGIILGFLSITLINRPIPKTLKLMIVFDYISFSSAVQALFFSLVVGWQNLFVLSFIMSGLMVDGFTAIIIFALL